MKNMRIVTLGLLIVCMLTSCNMLPVEKEILEPPTVKEYKKEELKLTTVKRDTLTKETYLRGEFLSAQRQDLFFEKGDFELKNIYVAKDDFVHKGDLIAETENEDLEEKLNQKRQDIEKMKLAIEQNYQTQEMELKKEQENLDEYTAKYNKAMELEKQFGDKNYVYTKNDLEKLEEKIDSQNKVIEKLFLENKITNQKKDSELEIAQAELQNLQQQYNETKVFSNISGQVTFVKDFKPGDKTVPKEVLVTVMDKSSALFRVDENKDKKFELGEQAEIIYNDQKLIGRVISPIGVVTPENIKSNAYYMKVDNMPTGIKEGESGKIYVLLDKADNVLYLPKTAINNANGESFVYTYTNEIKEKCVVKTGFATDYLIEITTGLSEGQIVLVQ